MPWTDALVAARRLGDLPPLVHDLVAPSTPGLRPRSTPAIRAEAEERYRRMRHQALMSFLTPTLICWVIWLATWVGDEPYFPWPLFVTIGTGLGWVRLVTSKEDTIASLERTTARQEQRRLEAARRREQRQLGGRPSYPPPYPPQPPQPHERP